MALPRQVSAERDGCLGFRTLSQVCTKHTVIYIYLHRWSVLLSYSRIHAYGEVGRNPCDLSYKSISDEKEQPHNRLFRRGCCSVQAANQASRLLPSFLSGEGAGESIMKQEHKSWGSLAAVSNKL